MDAYLLDVAYYLVASGSPHWEDEYLITTAASGAGVAPGVRSVQSSSKPRNQYLIIPPSLETSYPVLHAPHRTIHTSERANLFSLTTPQDIYRLRLIEQLLITPYENY